MSNVIMWHLLYGKCIDRLYLYLVNCFTHLEVTIAHVDCYSATVISNGTQGHLLGHLLVRQPKLMSCKGGKDLPAPCWPKLASVSTHARAHAQ